MDTTIVKGLRVLEALAASDQARGTSELAREIDLNKSNVQRILGTLLSLGYVEKDPATNRYSASLRMWEFGVRVAHRNQVRRAAQGYLRALFEKLNETIFLCVRDNEDVLYLDKMESAAPVRLSSQVGFRAPAIRTASGKAILAHQQSDVLERAIVAGREHFQINDVDVSNLRDELAAIRRDGYAISESGYRTGINSIAAPIWARDGSVVGSIAITGPLERLTRAKLITFAPDIVNTATRISESL